MNVLSDVELLSEYDSVRQRITFINMGDGMQSPSTKSTLYNLKLKSSAILTEINLRGLEPNIGEFML